MNGGIRSLTSFYIGSLWLHSGKTSPSVCSTKGFSLGGNKLHSMHLVWYTQRMTFSETEGNPVCIFPV